MSDCVTEISISKKQRCDKCCKFCGAQNHNVKTCPNKLLNFATSQQTDAVNSQTDDFSVLIIQNSNNIVTSNDSLMSLSLYQLASKFETLDDAVV